jgi:hypothetical protein
MTEAELLEQTKSVLCAPYLELVCQCAGFGTCGGCKVFKLARQWVEIFGKQPCKHIETWVMTTPEHPSHPLRRCSECKAIMPKSIETT